MREHVLSVLVVSLGLLIVSPASAAQKLTENTRRLGEGESAPRAELASLAWIAGSWTGSGLGGEVEEIWAAPSGGSMVGAFKLLRSGEPSFYELMLILEEEGSLVLRLKHFNPDFTGWEEKDRAVSFRLVELEDGAAFFDGLTYRRVGDDRLDVFLAMRRSQGENAAPVFEEVAFSFRRAGGAGSGS